MHYSAVFTETDYSAETLADVSGLFGAYASHQVCEVGFVPSVLFGFFLGQTVKFGQRHSILEHRASLALYFGFVLYAFHHCHRRSAFHQFYI